ncbi:hypothetical protein M8C21_004825 [Ambrosia artemisiifolia]|uniref:Uncharacterized protein n=1 Tax=Ambrosia artemisiifolia TaxID=4212 RepID=A0AAD5CN45_AMBAR|nr:hypothetical protein M8C21_004825 [Ambrosia artemisiifolia]
MMGKTMADSEGYGSSGRVGTDEPRKKSMNLNSCDSNQQFGVPLNVISLSNLSGFERKQLELRLKGELERVRMLRKRIEDGFLPSSDVNSHNAGQRKDRVNVLKDIRNVNGNVGLKKVGRPPAATGNPVLMKQCDTLLKRLMGHNFGWVFNTPVDVVALKIPDYHTVIKHPMDLGTVKTKLSSGKYADPWGFVADVRLTFSNAMTYNPRGNDVHVMAETLSKFFEVRWKAIEKKLSVGTESLVPMRRNVQETEPEGVTIMPPIKKRRTVSVGVEIQQEPLMKKKKVLVMSVVEKHKLGSDLEASLADLPATIVDFLKQNSSNGNAAMDEEIEIDIDRLSDETLFKLRKLLDDFLVGKQKNMMEEETCEVEIRNESGPSNSSMQAVKDDMDDEDVDIGDDDLPITSFPPVEIEKDTAAKSSKCSSSSTSSSDSGSSSSGLCGF